MSGSHNLPDKLGDQKAGFDNDVIYQQWLGDDIGYFLGVGEASLTGVSSKIAANGLLYDKDNGVLYQNTGTFTSPTFTPLTAS